MLPGLLAPIPPQNCGGQSRWRAGANKCTRAGEVYGKRDGHPDKGQTAGSTDMHPCRQQLQEDQGVVGFQM